jgi:hypothetical protein
MDGMTKETLHEIRKFARKHAWEKGMTSNQYYSVLKHQAETFNFINIKQTQSVGLPEEFTQTGVTA